jgi:hypothetical protein
VATSVAAHAPALAEAAAVAAVASTAVVVAVVVTPADIAKPTRFQNRRAEDHSSALLLFYRQWPLQHFLAALEVLTGAKSIAV